MNKMLLNICKAHGIDPSEPGAQKRAMDLLTGNGDTPSATEQEPKREVMYVCGACRHELGYDEATNSRFMTVLCPHCGSFNKLN